MIYLIDAAAILNDEMFYFSPSKKYITTSLVALEIRDFRSKALLDSALNNNFLRIQDPSAEAIKKISEIAKSIGSRLSKADFSLIALALEMQKQKQKVKVITDDFSIQNILLKLRISFESVIQGKIKKLRTFNRKSVF